MSAADHSNIAYKGGGVYACSCGHPLNDEGDALTFRPHPLREASPAVADLKVAHLAHRLEVEPENLR